MKYLISAIFTLIPFISCHSQSNEFTFSYSNFEEEILRYEPVQMGIEEKDFKHGVFILNEVKKDISNDPEGFNRADYFNILSAFLSLKQSKENVLIAYGKFKDSEGSCEYFLAGGLFKSELYDVIRDQIEKQIFLCTTSASTEPADIDLKTYSSENNLDYDLVALIAEISKLDAKYRGSENADWSKQTPIDLENQRLIDSLYAAHKKYIGTSLVGEEFNYVMWIVIQHSNLRMMEKFLPIVQDAVEQGEIGVTPFKMLIDRVYAQKENYQIFGSQQGVELASEEIRKRLILKYGLE